MLEQTREFFLSFFVVLQVLGDETRRREYDTMGAAGFGGGSGGFQQGQWQGTHIDPEELFRKIFGDAGFGGGGGRESSFGDSIFGGFDRGHEVRK